MERDVAEQIVMNKNLPKEDWVQRNMETTGLDREKLIRLQQDMDIYQKEFSTSTEDFRKMGAISPYLRREQSFEKAATVMRRHTSGTFFNSSNRTGRTNYDEDMVYRAEKHGLEFETIAMPPIEYIERATKILSKSEGKPLTVDEVELSRRDSFFMIRDKMVEAGRFDIPYLDYSEIGLGQEGINRAMAARDLGMREIPVRVVRDSKETIRARESEKIKQSIDLNLEARPHDKIRARMLDEAKRKFDKGEISLDKYIQTFNKAHGTEVPLEFRRKPKKK